MIHRWIWDSVDMEIKELVIDTDQTADMLSLSWGSGGLVHLFQM